MLNHTLVNEALGAYPIGKERDLAVLLATELTGLKARVAALEAADTAQPVAAALVPPIVAGAPAAPKADASKSAQSAPAKDAKAAT